MKDPRQEAYREECAAAAHQGLGRLQWQHEHILFVSNLNDNVTEKLLRDELATCGPAPSVKIASLDGRSLGLARVELQPGIKPDRFISQFHQRELLGQRINVVVDHAARKFEQAVKDAKQPPSIPANREASRRSPKKRMRASDSPSFSPASPARPISDSDQPSPSKLKRSRVSSPVPSPRGNSDKRSHDANRTHEDRQFSHSRRDSHHYPEAHRRSESRNFANETYRDYPGWYHEHRDRHGGAYGHRGRSRPYHDSRRHRHESFGDYRDYGHGSRYGDWYDDRRRRDRRHRSDFRERHRSPQRHHERGHYREYSSRNNDYGYRDASRQAGMHSNDGAREHQWQNEYQPAISLEFVPRGTQSRDLLDAFREFYPKNVISNGRGHWTMWFEKTDDRDRAAASRHVRFRGAQLRISTSRHIVGRQSVPDDNPTSTHRDTRYSHEEDIRNMSNNPGRYSIDEVEPAKESNSRDWRRDSRRDADRRDSRRDRHWSGQITPYRGSNDKYRSHTDAHAASDFRREPAPAPESAVKERVDKYNLDERLHEEEKRPPHEQEHGEHGGDDAKREQQAGRYDAHRKTSPSVRPPHDEEDGRRRPSPTFSKSVSRAPRDMAKPNIGSALVGEGARSAGSSQRESVQKDEIQRTTDKPVPAAAEHDGPRMNLSARPADAVKPSERESPQPKTDPKLTSKNLPLEEFADIVAKYVYQRTKETITSRRSAVQKGVVNQTVAKFIKAKKSIEKEKSKRTAQAWLNKGKKTSSVNEGSESNIKKTAHLDLVETFLKPTSQKQKKPPLPDRSPETPVRKKLKRSRFGDIPTSESERKGKAEPSQKEEEDRESQNDPPPKSITKRRRLVLPDSPESPHSGHASPDEKRQNSVDSVASSELFHGKDFESKHTSDDKRKHGDSGGSDAIVMSMRVEKPQIRHTKASSLKLSTPSMGNGAIPRLVLSARPPPSPVTSVPPGSALTSSEDNTSQEPSTPSDIATETTQKPEPSGKSKKRPSRGKSRKTKKQNNQTSDDERYASLLLSLNDTISKPSDATRLEILQDCGFIHLSDGSDDDAQLLLSKRLKRVSNNAKPSSLSEKRPLQGATVEKKEPDEVRKAVEENASASLVQPEEEKVEPENHKPPERMGKCARTDVYVRAENTGQHRQRNVHSRTSTSTQSSRECRQENRVYRKGVSHINPKNDIISFNHLKQRRKQVSFGQSRIHGMGLYAKENIEAGEFIIEYVGDLIRRVVADLREKKYARQGMGDSYLFRLSGDWVVDATRRGGIARYINHSCDPSVYAKIISVVGEPKIVFYSKRNIKEGEELTYDYKFDYEAEDQKIPCLCKAATCRKYLN